MIDKDHPSHRHLANSPEYSTTGFPLPETWTGRLAALLILAAIALLVASCFRVPTDADSFFHLATGRNWFAYGLSPFVDHLTFTFFGEPVSNQPIFFQGMLYGYVAIFGLESGYAALKLTFMLLTVATVGWLAFRTRAPWPLAALVFAILVFALQTRVQARPELGIFWFTALAMVLYHRALAGENPGVNAANMIPVAVLTAIWVAWYTSIFAYVIFFGLFVDLAIRQWNNRAPRAEWLRWFAWGLLVVVLGWGPPHFSHDLISTLTFSREWTQLIEEWAPPVRLFSMPGLWILALAGLAAILLCVRSRSFGLLIILVVFLQQTIQISRLIAPTGIVIACALLHLAALRNRTPGGELPGSPPQRGLPALAMLLATVTVASSAYFTKLHLSWDEWRGSAWPNHLTEHLRENWTPGRIFNPMIRGGYLAYELGPDYQTYIDGRVNHLFSMEFFKHHLTVLGSSTALQSELDRYDVDYLVAPEDISADRYLSGLEDWELDFADVNDLLFVRGSGRFPVSGLLRTAPECWTPAMAGALREEERSASEILPAGNPLSPMIRHTLAFDTSSGTSEALLNDFDPSIDWRAARLIAYRASDEGQHDRVIRLLANQPYRFFKDGLVLAKAHLESGELSQADALLTRLLSESWLQFEQRDLAVLASLFSALAQEGAVAGLDPASVREFLSQNGFWPPQGGVEEIRTPELCHRARGTLSP